MGTYCELNRELIEEDFNKERNVKLWRNLNVVTKLPQTTTGFETSKPTISSSSSPSISSTTKWASKTSTHNNPFHVESTSAKSSQAKTHASAMPTTKIIIKSMKESSLCKPNPCMNEATCELVYDSFKCVCTNASFTGKYCEHFRFVSQQKPKSHNAAVIVKSTATMKPLADKTTVVAAHKSKIDSQEPLPYYTRAFFWQCPSNCLFNLGRGFCTLSSSGYPRCACRDEWTGVDCGQRNYCLNNECTNNSTCSNYPEMR